MARNPLVLAVLVSFGSVSAGFAGDTLFDRHEHDFGPIPRGPTQTTSFEVTNKTAGPIHLGGVRIPCSCVRAAVSKNDLKAGESTTVVVYLDTRRVTGPLNKSIFVQLDREEVRLTIKAQIREDLIVAPETLAFGQVKPGSGKDTSVTVLLTGKAAGKIVKAESESGYVQAQVRELPRDSNGISYQVSAHLQPGLSPGAWFSTVWLTTDNPAVPRFPISVSVEVQAEKSKSR
jgi:hypothetical protein